MTRILSRVLPIFPVLFRLIVGATFLVAGVEKISEPAFFAQTVRAYQVLPIPLINPFAITVPWIEVAVGLFLVLGLWTRSSSLISLLLLLSFAVALGINISQGADFSCGCFGLGGGSGSLWRALVLDSFLIAISIVLLFVSAMRFSLDRLFSRA